jgi:hypothetical protein
MNSYILLRNNKESGPHSLDQLMEMGIRTNDLIWVEGQSAAWRNPGEIKELKDLVGQTSSDVPPIVVTPKDEPAIHDVTPVQPAAKKTKVFVEMPVQPRQVVKEETYMPKPVEAVTFVEPRQEEVKVETKYAMSMDEIKERYVRNLEENRRRHQRLKIKFPPWLVRAAVYTGLVGVGAVTVWLLRDPGKVKVMTQQQPSILPQKFDVRPDTVEENYPLVPQDQQVNSDSYEDQQRKSEPRSLIEGNQRTVDAVNENSKKRISKTTSPGSDETATTLNDRISIPNNEVAEIKKSAMPDLSEQVSVKTNSYTIAALGGIRNLELTLQNDSRFTLDKVIVELRYLNPGGVILKTEDVHFKSVQPSGSQTIAIKKTNRGVKVSCKVMKIESKDIGSTAGL